MSVEADFLTLLQASTSFVASVGGRIYPNVIPENPSWPGPSVVIKVLDDPLAISHSGPTGLRFAHYRFDFYAQAKEDAIAGRDALNAFLGALSNTKAGATLFAGATHRKEMDAYERDTRLFRELVEWDIAHSP